MLYVLIALALGVVGGRIFREKITKSLMPVIMFFVCELLFIMGVRVGMNDHIIHNLSSLGVVSLVIFVFGTLGSVIATYFFTKWVNKKASSKTVKQ